MRRFPVTRRRPAAAALAALLVATVAVLVLLLGGGGDPPAPSEPPPGTTVETAGGPGGELTDEELVDQVLLVAFEGAGTDPDLLEKLERRQIGGVLIRADNWDGAGPGAELVEAIREAGGEGGRIEPLVATAQEGGPYRALADLPPEQRQVEIGDRGDRELAREWALETGTALDAVGIDLNLAPIADVATLDSAIADRAFSDDPALATAMTAAAVEGCRESGIACALAHFPGQGAATRSTADGPVSISLDSRVLSERDLAPFRAGFEAGVPAVVVSHAIYTAYDPVTPATLSPEIAAALLRDELGFDGVAISDDIGAGAIAAGRDPGAAAVAAIGAGIDLVQVADPADVEPARDALLEAVASGELERERLAEAAGRVIGLKRDLERKRERAEVEAEKEAKAEDN